VYDTVSIRLTIPQNKPLRICATLCRARIIPEQNASKIVKKNISTDGEVMAKIKVASFSGIQCIEFITNLMKLLVVFGSTFHVAYRLRDVPKTKVHKLRLFTEHKQTDAGLSTWLSIYHG